MSYSTNAAGVSKYTADRHQRILQDLLQQPGNGIMARKSVNLDAWSKEQIESVKTIGNINANAKWNPNEARHPPPTNLEESERDSEMEKYIRAKYETKRFMDRNPPSKVQTSMSSTNPYASASTSATPISASAGSPSTARPPKPEPVDPSQTVRLGFGRESRVEFSLGPGGGVDMFDEIVQQKKPPPRSRTAPIPEAPKEVAPPTPAVPTPVSSATLSAAFPSRSVSAQPPGVVGTSGIGGLGTGTGMATAVPSNPVWGDMMALQSGGPLPTQTPQQMSPLTQNNPYASLGASPSLPSTLANRFNQARSFTAPVNTGIGMGTPVNLGTGGAAPNPFFQQPAATGSSVLSSGSFGSGSMLSAPTGGSFGSTGSGMGVSPGGAFGGNPFGTSAGAGGSLGISTGGTFGTPVSTLQSGFGASPSAFGTSTLSPQGSTQAFTSSTQQQPSPFQTNTLSPFGSATSNLGASPNTSSLGAFGAAMSPGAGQLTNSPFGASNSPYLQTNVPSGFQGGSSPFQPTGATPFQQSTPASNALFLQPNSSSPFQQSNSPFQQSNSPFPNSNSPYQANTTFAPTSNNPFGTAGMASTNPFGPQQQQQFQAQFQNQGWGGM
ncbi:hypothetical protein FRC07_000023 [Ceratobasidium sp. 392]|nr:hypothetical protein FRC07_000023 [Ceratobasidium sp. 392]